MGRATEILTYDRKVNDKSQLSHLGHTQIMELRRQAKRKEKEVIVTAMRNKDGSVIGVTELRKVVKIAKENVWF